MTLEQNLEFSKRRKQLQDLAEKLFGSLVTWGTESRYCECCKEVHHNSTITIKDPDKGHEGYRLPKL